MLITGVGCLPVSGHCEKEHKDNDPGKELRTIIYLRENDLAVKLCTG